MLPALAYDAHTVFFYSLALGHVPQGDTALPLPWVGTGLRELRDEKALGI